jgi:hypothetical protein
MSLKWELASFDAISEWRYELVFRLHKTSTKVKYLNKMQEFDVYKLQIKKRSDISFKDLGYTYFLDDSDAPSDYSVDGKLWNDIEEIAESATQILKTLRFIPAY